MSKPKSLRILYIVLALTLACCLAMLTLVACDKTSEEETPASITVTFMVDSSVYKSITLEEGGTLTLPENPTKEGYDFAGWYLDKEFAEAFDAAKLEKSIAVYAKWTEKGAAPTDPTPTSLTVTFVVDGVTYQSLTVEAGGTLTLPATPTKEGYDFAGWFLDEALTQTFDPTAVDTNVTIYAKWVAHVHAFGAWTETTPATCTTAGEETRTCSCGATETRPIEALGHDYSAWTITTPATHTEPGEETRVCSRDANHKETRPIEATGHSFGDWSITTPATCTTAGVETRTCSCGATDTRPIEPLGHDYGAWTITTPATCTTAGEETRVCSRDAKHKETRPTEALGHDYQSVPETPATYTTTGVAAHFTCSRCDVIFDADKNPTTAEALVLAKKPFAITFDMAGGSPQQADVEATNYGAWPTLTTVPTRTGYTFDGYYAAGDAHVYDGALTCRSGACFFDGPDTLTAHWTPVQVTVFFDHNGGSSTLASNQATYGSDLRALSEELLPTKAGYVFTGYFTATEGGVKYYNEDGTSAKTCDLTVNTTLYAQWANGIYFVRYNANAESGISGTMANQQMTCDKTETISASGFTRTGYTFVKWNTQADGKGTDYLPASEVADLAGNAETFDLYAVWSAKEYTVTLDKQSGTGGSDSFSATTDEMPEDLAGVPTRYGYTFEGYFSSTKAGDKYFDADGRAVKAWAIDAESPVLYAHWTPKTTTISVYDNGVKKAEMIATYDAIMPSGYSAGTLTGHTLVGIFDAEEDGTMYYDNNGYYVRKWDKEDAAVNLYVRWSANKYTVSFLPKQNNSTYETTGAMEPIEVTYGQPMPHVDITYGRVGYTVLYLRYNGASTINFYDANGDSLHVYDVAGDSTLTAVWEPNTYQISFDGNGATGGSQASVKIGYDSRVQNLTPGYTRTGYTFNGYFDAAEGGTEWVNMWGGVEDSLIYVYTEDTVLYAHWTPKKYSVSWLGNDGTINLASIEATYDADMPAIDPTKCTRTGYNFTGFFDAATGGNKYYNADGTSARKWTLTPGGTYYLYAQWTPATYTVSFDMRGGTPQQADITVTYRTLMPTDDVTVVPTKQYFVFGGYYNEDSSICYYTSVLGPWVSWGTAGNGTLYAVWNNGSYSVKYLTNGGSGSYYTDGFTNNVAKALRNTAFSRTGYTLTGWNTKADGTGTHYDLGESVTNLADNGETFDLYAEWTAREYNVTLINGKGEFDLSFDLNYEDAPAAPATQHITYATTMVYPIPAVREGYLFGGWYRNPECTYYFDLSSTISADTTLYAKWIAYDGDATIVNPDSTNEITVTSEDQKFVIYTLASGTLKIRVNKDATIVYNGSDNAGALNLGVGNGYSETFIVHSKNRSEDAEYTGAATLTISRVVSEGGRAGSAQNQTVKVAYDSLPDLSDYLPTSEGYTFGGWYTSSNGGGTQITDAEGNGVNPYEFDYNSNLYAYWIGNEYTVTLDDTAGSGGPGSATVVFDRYPDNIDPAELPTREDYDFIGYWSEESGGTQYIDRNGNGAGTWLFASDRTLYAHWSLAHYSIVYDANGGDSGSMTEDEPQRTRDFSLANCQYGRTGYTFTEWNTAADGTGTSYAASATVNNLAAAHGSITLYAQWTAKTYTVTPVKNRVFSHTVTFDLNGAEGETPAAQVVDVVTDLVLPLPTRDGYLFAGWYDNAACTGDAYDMTVTHADDVKLYAKWVERTVVLDEETLAELLLVGDQKVVTLTGSTWIYIPFISPVDQTIKMWSVRGSSNADPYATLYQANKETAITSNDDGGGNRNFLITRDLTANTLYYLAVKEFYDIKGESITVHIEGAQKKSGARHPDEALSDETATYDASYDLPVPELTGYVFDGWYTLPDGAGTKLTDAAGHSLADWTIAEDTKVYAKWTIGTYTITFDANGGSGEQSAVEVTYGDPMTAVTPAVTRDNYDFLGYFDAAEGGTKYYNADGTSAHLLDKGADTKLYAHWQGKSYTVAFDGNGSNGGSMSAQAISYATATNLTANAFTKTGYTFSGWNTASDGTGTSYADEAEVTDLVAPGQTITLFAKWTIKVAAVTLVSSPSDHVTVRFNLNGADGANPTPQRVTATTGLTLPVPTRDGYAFAGWFDNYECTGTPFDGAASLEADVLLYAKWISCDDSANFISVGGSKTGLSGSSTTYYPIVPLKSQTIRVYSTGDYDVHGYLYSSSKSQLISDDDSGEGNNFLFEYEVTAGTLYYVGLWGHGDSLYMNMEIHVEGEGQADGGLFERETLTPVNLTYGTASFSLAKPDAKANYTFGGWYTAPNGGGTQITDEDGDSVVAWTIDATAVTLYAKWTGTAVTVYFDANGGSGAPSEVTAYYGAEMPAISDMPTYTDMVFMGFFDQTIGGNMYYDAELNPVCDSDMIYYGMLYAQWEYQPYYVAFHAADATSGSMATQVISRTMLTPLNANAYERTGYDFAGWNTEEDGSGYSFSDGDSVMDAVEAYGTLNLYAQWTLKHTAVSLRDEAIHAVTVSFDLNGATGSAPETQTLTSSDSLIYPSVPTRVGYLFAGWYETEECTGDPFDFTEDVEVPSVTLYAKWIEVPDWATGTISMGGEVNLTLDGKNLRYYVFVPLVSGSITVYSTSETDTFGEFYNADKEKLTDNDDSGENNNFSITYGATAGRLYAVAVRAYGESDTSACAVVLEGTATPDASGKSASHVVAVLDTVYGSETSFGTASVKYNYEFMGWYTGKNGAGTQYANGSGTATRAWDIEDEAVTLYAYYRGVQCSVAFEKEGGSGGDEFVVARYTETMPSASAPTRTGYNFLGFFSEEDGLGTQYYSAKMEPLQGWDHTSNGILYACWTPIVYEVTLADIDKPTVAVTFDLNGAPGENPATQVILDETTLTYPDAPTRSGYFFAGWYETPACTGDPFDFSGTINHDVSLFAKWIAVPASVGGYDVTGILPMNDSFNQTMKGNTVSFCYIFVPLVSETYTIYAYAQQGSSVEYDTRAYLYESDMTLVIESDDYKGHRDFHISTELEAGKLYALVIQGVYDTTTGTVPIYTTVSTLTPADGASHSSDAKEMVLIEYDEDSFSLSIPVKAGYTFDGWYDGEGGTGTKYTDENGDAVKAWDKTAATTLYAKWIED